MGGGAGRWRSAFTWRWGLAGLPIFAQGGGLSYLLQPSFGYLIGFAAGAFVTGTMARSGPVTFRRLLTANLVGLGVVYLFGMLYYYGICQVLGTPIGFWPLFLYGFVLGRPRGFGAVCSGGCFGHAPASRHSKGEKSMTVTETLGRKVLAGGQLTKKEAMTLYGQPLEELCTMADTVRARFTPGVFTLHHCQWEEWPLHGELPLLRPVCPLSHRGGGVPAV